jgi:superfamily I DNA/RNA helicase
MQNMTMIDQDSRKHSKRKDVVFLGTSHAWKGLEADHFFLPMSKDSFPDPRADEKEERRLAYVALTRGRDSVRVLCQEPYVINNKGDTRGGISKFVTEACIKDRDLLEIDKEASIDDEGMISKKGFDLFMKSHMTPQMMIAFKHLLK